MIPFSNAGHLSRNIIKRCRLLFPPVRSLNSYTNLLEVSNQDGVRTINLIDAKTRNSLSLPMLEQLRSALTAKSDDLRCVLLTAQGPAFSAGHNLKDILAGDRPSHDELFELCRKMMADVRATPVPVVASVSGVAAAAGCQLVAACDVVVAAETATFSTPGVTVGLFCSTPGVPLSRAVPRKVAAMMLMTGRPLTAQQALQAGLVSLVVPKEELEAETQRVVASILGKSKPVLALGKDFFYRQLEMTEDEAYREGSDVMVHNINTPDGQEGIRSFVEKRKPDWTHQDN